MESPKKTTFRLDQLPVELLQMIIVYLYMDNSLQCLSLVNTQFRHLCIPYLFRVLTIAFSSAGLDRLEQASCSRIAHHVRVIR